MKKRKHLVLLMGVFVCFLFGLASNRRAFALNCNNVTEAMNSSVYQACQRWRRAPQNPVGTMWLSSSSDSSSLSTSIETQASTGKITVYLHGAIIGGGENGAWADFVKFSSRDFVSEEYNSVSDYAPLSTLDGNRRFHREGNTNPLQKDIKSSVVELKLDIDKLVEIERSYVPEGENYRRYTVELYGFRCYEGKTPFNNPRDCWANESKVTVKLPQASIVGKTGVTNNNRQSSTTLQSSDTEAELLFADNCEKGCKFTFTHTLKKSVLGQGSISYTITNSKNSTDSINEQTKSFNSNDTDSHEVKTFSVTLYPGEKYCSKMTFQIGLGGKNATTQACAAAAGKLETDVSVEAQVWRGGTMVGKRKEGTIYVKPGDNKQLLVTYTSDVQRAFNIRTEGMKYAGMSGLSLYRNNKLGLLFNSTVASSSNLSYGWNNSFSIFRNGKVLTNQNGSPKVYKRFDAGTYFGQSIGPGNQLWSKTWESSFYYFGENGKTIGPEEVGTSETMEAKTNHKVEGYENYNKAANTVPSKVEFYSYDALKTTGKELVLESTLDSNLVLSSGGGFNNGVNVQVNSKSKSDASQRWKLLDAGDGYYYIASSSKSDYVLDIKGANTNNGTNVQLHKKNNTDAQKWKLERNGGGTYTIVSKLNRNGQKLVLDVSGASANNGANVQIYQSNNTKSQKWNIGRSQYLVANVEVEPKESKKVVIAVPYNFNNTIKLTTLEGKESFNSSDGIQYNIMVGERPNGVVSPGEPYATMVRGAKHGVEWCVAKENTKSGEYSRDNDVCKEGGVRDNGEIKEEQTLRPSDSESQIVNLVTKESRSKFEGLGVGEVICVRAKVYPASSLLDTQIKSEWGDEDKNTAYSDWWCLPIKEQDKYLQVWGGNVYSSNGIEGTSVEKQFGEMKRWFGSFGELGVISGGEIKNFASGAAWGYVGVDSNTITIPSYSSMEGGDDERVFAMATSENGDKLAFPNVGNGAGVNSNKQKIGALIDTVATRSERSENEDCPSDIRISGTCKKIENEEIFVWKNSNGEKRITIDEINVPRGKTYIVRTEGDVIINSNITYESYSSLDDIPRMIIYAKNISIDPGVGRIDGLLIADENVNTCVKGDGTNLNLGSCNNQLMINGAVIAKSLVRQRSYGAGEGAQSIVPAEIINFDPSLYDLSRLGSSSSVGEMKTVNTVELAPRY